MAPIDNMLSHSQLTDMKAALEHPTARKAMTDLVLEVFHLNGGLLTVGDQHAPDQPHRRAILALLTEAGESAYRAAMLDQQRRADRLTACLAAKDVETATVILHELRRRLDGGADKVKRKHPPQKIGVEHDVR